MHPHPRNVSERVATGGVIVLIFCALLVGCSSPNLLQNGSFERGSAPWFSLETEHWESFTLSDRYAKEGRYAAHLALKAHHSDDGSKIAGLIQEIHPPKFPKKISGFYRVEHWLRGTTKQYLQFVVIVWGDRQEYPNIQVRYILAGLTEPPFTLRNGRFVFLGPREPVLKEWVFFERDLHRDFLELWGQIPKEFEKLRLLFEVRYDDKRPGAELLADVYYDALSLGGADNLSLFR